MTLLVDDATLERRRGVAAGALAPLAASLAAELAPLLERAPEIPRLKARLTRAGGRCAADGTLLVFDPQSPHRHRCAACGRTYEGAAHDRYWLLGYQLWLAERAVHAAVLHALGGDPRHAALADAILDGYAGQYLSYPNEDNVLGPGRPFFSTYLESIWLLQLCVALDLRERRGLSAELAGRVRARVVEPSAAVIASFDERSSNRQVWNNAALVAAARLLGDGVAVDRALHGSSGLVAHLSGALLADGTWYEGENYHLFAHRGLWYGVSLAEAAGASLPAALLARFERGFATPFLSALPDFTFPSRRDSQYAVSLRQWRFAELCELGLARGDDPVLAGALHRLYTDPVPRGDTGRARSTAEAERNEPATALTRADLGWRSLLFAREQLPALRARAARSVLLSAQGLAVFRRDGGRAFAALDYGHSGGGHGHPDRLNLLLMADGARWLDDAGTGSYVDRSLHWYRSTLAHNAPLVNGRSQARRHGRLVAYEERDAAGRVEAVAEELAPGVVLRRALVVMPDYLVDELRWAGPADTVVDLPMHVDARCTGVDGWQAGVPAGGDGAEDGFAFLREAACARAVAGACVRLDARLGDATLVGWTTADRAQEWWRATAPGVPGSPPGPFLFVRVLGGAGALRTVWSWGGRVRAARVRDGRVVVEMSDGTVHEHARADDGAWRVELIAGGARSSIVLAGMRAGAGPPPPTSRCRADRDRVAPESRAPHPFHAPLLPPRRRALPPLRAPVGGGRGARRRRAARARRRRARRGRGGAEVRPARARTRERGERARQRAPRHQRRRRADPSLAAGSGRGPGRRALALARGPAAGRAAVGPGERARRRGAPARRDRSADCGRVRRALQGAAPRPAPAPAGARGADPPGRAGERDAALARAAARPARAQWRLRRDRLPARRPAACRATSSLPACRWLSRSSLAPTWCSTSPSSRSTSPPPCGR